MVDFDAEYKKLAKSGLLPKSDYFLSSYAKPYNKSEEFLVGLILPILQPIANIVAAIGTALDAILDALRFVGNLLIIKPHAAGHALSDMTTHTVLTFALAIMAPIHALSGSLQVLTRTIAAWFSNEPTNDLTNLDFSATFATKIKVNAVDYLLPSFRKYQFFTPHSNVRSFLNSVATPVKTATLSGLYSLTFATFAVCNAIDLIANLIIAKPKHAGESGRDFSVHLSLALSLAIMAPINAWLYSIACITRLGSTWADAALQSENTTYRA